jgi:hypothetical protein
MKFLTWIGGSATIAGILHLIPILFGAGGAVLWFGVAYYKFKQARAEDKLAELLLKREQDKS